MQPDPSLFLAAIRREILAVDFFSAKLESGLSPILAARAGETLVHLALRHERLSDIAAEFQPRQVVLLDKILAYLREMKIEIPPPLQTFGVGAEIQKYELLASEIGSYINIWSRDFPANYPEILADVCREAASIEDGFRKRYNIELAKIRAESVERDKRLPALTPDPQAVELTRYLRRRFPKVDAIEVLELRRLPGVNSKDIYFFRVSGLPGWPEDMVLRREPAFNVTRASVADEFDLLRRLHEAGIAVPRVFLEERDPQFMGGAFIVMERSRGETFGAQHLGDAGRKIVADVARYLAAIHQIDVWTISEPYQPVDGSLRNQMLVVLDRYYARWVAERLEPSMALEAAYAWMRANAGCLGDDLSLVHGDCNFRNILIHDEGVSVFLDWELAHAGHAAEDLGYIRPDIEKVMSWEEFMVQYLAHGGRPVSDEALHYFQVWSNVWRTSMAASTYAGYARAEHDNFIFATVACHEYYAALDDLAALMARC
ncbi:hypothetical protein GCM10010909_06890 [Acidocella aquatica]|uniref:Aminoglycoside phosphotransferase domain-containing protein n=1 Tax=Acidocella aquatica TaxID=1922313 RepID=A0ABQ6A2J5_9PROT|nr:phosphotransferase family protein [Acidocella aquatica]GLR66011.1 hypothetical protein GCM10010909_06890 [Acidocella aquatica]